MECLGCLTHLFPGVGAVHLAAVYKSLPPGCAALWTNLPFRIHCVQRKEPLRSRDDRIERAAVYCDIGDDDVLVRKERLQVRPQ